jgi:hypothetical protein
LGSPDGRELFYRSGDSVMAVSVKTNPDFSCESPRQLFQRKYTSCSPSFMNNEYAPWDTSQDGKRFLIMKEVSDEVPRRINIVLNWLDELKRLVPVK